MSSFKGTTVRLLILYFIILSGWWIVSTWIPFKALSICISTRKSLENKNLTALSILYLNIDGASDFLG
jgi:hypothetical protein